MNVLERFNPREQKIIQIAILLLLLVVLYFALIRPFHKRLQNERHNYQLQRALLSDIKRNAPKITALKQWLGHYEPVTHTDLLAIVANSLKKSQLNTFEHHIAQSAPHSVDLTFTQVPFDNLLHWSNQLWQQHLIGLTQITAWPTPITGIVKVKLRLELARPQN